jgi:hypothetical protein
MVVVVALGERPSGGYGIYIDLTYETDDHLTINVISQTPGRNCAATAVLTHPVDIARLPRVESHGGISRNCHCEGLQMNTTAVPSPLNQLEARWKAEDVARELEGVEAHDLLLGRRNIVGWV